MGVGVRKEHVDLLCIFVHGFKGKDSTFDEFPERLQHMMSEQGDVRVECLTFPTYETRGELTDARDRFVEWLTTTVVNKEAASGDGKPSNKTNVVLCGHSMGGLLIADALIAIANNSSGNQPQSTTSENRPTALWPRIIACIAFDTPYYGLNPQVFKNTASKAVQAVQDLATGLGFLGALTENAQSISQPKADDKSPNERPVSPKDEKTARRTSSGSKDMIPQPSTDDAEPSPAPNPRRRKSTLLYALGGVALAGAAAGTAYYKRRSLGAGISRAQASVDWAWPKDHLRYVQNLWDDKALKGRVETLIKLRTERGVYFKNFYTSLPPTDASPEERTFILLPSADWPSFQFFVPNPNSLAASEIDAHTGMFKESLNDGLHDLGLRTGEIMRKAIEEIKNIDEDEERKQKQQISKTASAVAHGKN